MPSTFQRVIASAFRIDRRNVEVLFVLRCSLGVAIALIGGYILGQPLFAVAGAMGAMSTGFASLQGVYRTRAATMLAMALAMALSTIAGMLAAKSPVASFAVLALWGYAFGVCASLGGPGTVVGVNALVALIVFNHFSATGSTMWLTAACMIGGGAIQTLLVVVLWPVQRYPYERAALAQAYRSLAIYARELDAANPALPPATQLETVRATLADPRPFGRNDAIAAFSTLLAEAERIRATLGRLAARGGNAYDAERSTVAATLDTIARALANASAPNDAALEAHLVAEHDDPVVRLLFGQLRAAWRSAAVPLHGVTLAHARLLKNVFPDVAEVLATLRANLWLDSPFGRHAVRLAVVLASCDAIVHVVHWDRGYWMTLTAALVLRPDFATTLSRGIARIAGTLAGVGVATALVVLLPDTPHVSMALVLIFATLAYATFQMNYALFSWMITSYVVFLIALLGAPEEAAIVNRLAATVAGGAFAMISYVVWPTWEASHLRARLVALLNASRAYDRLILAGLIDPKQRDARAASATRQEAWKARSAAQESLERMLSEPSATHEIDADLAVATMAATQRIALANLSLGSLYADRNAPAFPEAEPFARALESAFAGITMAIDHGSPPFAAQLLRDQHAALAHALPADRYGHTTFLASTDLLVDGINTIADLWSHRGS